MSTAFAHALSEAKGDLGLNQIAREIAGPKAKNPRGPAGNLSRLQKGTQEPSKGKVEQIVKALASLKQLSPSEVKYWRSRLMSAAGHSSLSAARKLSESEAQVREALRPGCEEVLAKVESLTPRQIQMILDHAEVATMRLIIAADENGEEIEVIPLMRYADETGQRAISADSGQNTDRGSDSLVKIPAGRAQIHVDGEVTPGQRQILKKAAEMIEAVLQA